MEDEPHAKCYEEWKRRYARRYQRTDWRGVYVTLAILGMAAMIGAAAASLLG